MENKIFKFATVATWEKVVKALNDTMYLFYCPAEKQINLYGLPACNNLENALKECGWKYTI